MLAHSIDQYETEDKDSFVFLLNLGYGSKFYIKKLATVNLILLPPAVLIEIEEELFYSIYFIG